MGKLSTHVLDTIHGCPAEGVRIELYKLENGGRSLLKAVRTNSDGRCDEPLLRGEYLVAGKYELVFFVGESFAFKGIQTAKLPFLDDIPVRFAITDIEENYHVPLVMTPWAYSTYRGS